MKENEQQATDEKSDNLKTSSSPTSPEAVDATKEKSEAPAKASANNSDEPDSAMQLATTVMGAVSMIAVSQF